MMHESTVPPRLGQISPAIVHAAGVVRVSTHEARSLGFCGNGLDGVDLSGWAFPYRHPLTKAVLTTRLRPDTPVSGRKYLAAAGSRNHLYLPGKYEQQLSDSRFDALITEGEKKSLSLVETVGAKYLVVGVSGVWNWRTSDKEKQPQADRPTTTTVRTNSRAIEDLDWIVWKGRRCFILFDSDATDKPDVRLAEERLAQELSRRGAQPLIVSLPPATDGSKQGIDDLLGSHEPSARLGVLESLLRGAAPRRHTRSSEDTALDLRWDPPGGFLRTFEEFADEQTDAPAVYRPFTALAVLSAVVGRQVTMPWFGGSDLVPNLYVCLLGASSFAHKTTMISMAERLVRRTRPDRLLPDEFTPEKFLGLLETSPTAFLGLPEFAGFLARSGRDYNLGTRELIMQLYDCPEEYRRALQSKQICVKNPAVTVLGASATSWLSDAMDAGDLRSGFFNRFCFVVGGQQEKLYALPGTAHTGSESLSLMVEQLKRVGEVQGVMNYAKVRRPYEAWYRDLAREGQRAEPVEVVSAFYTRLAVTTMKFAMLIELAKNRSLELTEASLSEAIYLVDYLRAALKHLLKVDFAPTKFAKQSQRVLDVIAKNRGIKRGQLLKKTGFSAKDLNATLETLQLQGDAYEQGGGWWKS